MTPRSEPNAVQAAATEPLTVADDERLEHAARLMTEHGVSHLVVLGSPDGHAIGVIATLDIAAVYAQNVNESF